MKISFHNCPATAIKISFMSDDYARNQLTLMQIISDVTMQFFKLNEWSVILFDTQWNIVNFINLLWKKLTHQ